MTTGNNLDTTLSSDGLMDLLGSNYQIEADETEPSNDRVTVEELSTTEDIQAPPKSTTQQMESSLLNHASEELEILAQKFDRHLEKRKAVLDIVLNRNLASYRFTIPQLE